MCYCFSQYKGEKCQEENTHGWYQSDDQCENLISRLDNLLNINPIFYDNEDQEFPRLSGKSVQEDTQINENINKEWIKIQDIKSQREFNIFGDRLSTKQFQQGDLANCYFLSSLASLSKIRKGQIIKDIFYTKGDNEKHVYVTRWFIGGKPRFVAVDQWIPGNKKEPIFTKNFKGNSFWAIILEKAWAKIHGQYQSTQFGSEQEILSALIQSRSYYIIHEDFEQEKIYEQIRLYLYRDFPVESATKFQSQNDDKNQSLHLEQNHQYSVLQAYQVEKDNGEKIKLIKVFNPYNKEKWIENPWGNESPNWSKKMKQIYKIEQGEGIFHLTPEDYFEQFEETSWSEFYYDYNISWIDIPFKKDQLTYTVDFFLKGIEDRNFYAFIDQFSSRFLNKHNCKIPFKYVPETFILIDPNNKILQGGKYKPEIKVKQAKDGRYTLDVILKDQQKYIKYFTFSVYAPKGSLTFVNQFDKIIENEQKQCENNCNGRGRCNTFNGECACYYGYSGQDCSKTILKSCLNNCNNNGICDQRFGICDCHQGFTGEDCQPCKDLINCQVFVQLGACEIASEYYEFVKDYCQKSCAELNYKGFSQCNPNLEIKSDKCFDIDCGDFGKCVDGLCICKKGFTGINCQDLDIKECKDQIPKELCKNYKKMGYCKNINKQIMVLECPQSCKFC